jgi:hypothetical protein
MEATTFGCLKHSVWGTDTSGALDGRTMKNMEGFVRRCLAFVEMSLK